MFLPGMNANFMAFVGDPSHNIRELQDLCAGDKEGRFGAIGG
jgi:hypothetical protein